MITFEQIGIRKELLKAIADLGFEIPMPIQEQVIPALLNTDNDVIGLSQTGSGKTAAYGLPVLNSINESLNSPQILVLCPTRELCIQITRDFEHYAKYMTNIVITSVYGGAPIDMQIKSLNKGTHIVVGTPGRMNDLIRRNKIKLEHINTLILDEADEMLNLGFKEELNSILEELPKQRRTLLFSATMPNEVAKIASKYMKNAEEIIVGNKNSGADSVQHNYYVVKASDRYQALKRIVDYYPAIYGLIFCRTRMETKEVAEKLMKDGYNADALHGDLSQVQREYAMQRFRLRNLQMLVATDVAARGLDVEDLTHVINYNMPDDDEIYIHRSGRTGRAGKKGLCISICNTREVSRIKNLSKTVRKEFVLKNVPKGEEICEKQLFNVINRMENVEVNKEQIDDFLPIVFKKLEWLSREELITKFVSVEFNRFLTYYKDAVDINISTSKENNRFENSRDRKKEKINDNMVLLKINLGNIENLTPQKLIGLINDSTRTRDITIGKVNINKSITLFEADKNSTELLLKSFYDVTYEGRKVILKIADINPPEPREPRSDYKKGNKEQREYKGNRDFNDKPNFKEKREYKDKDSYKSKPDYKEKKDYKDKDGYKSKPEFKEKREYKDRDSYKSKPDYKEKKDYKDKDGYKSKPDFKEKRVYKDKDDHKFKPDFKEKSEYKGKDGYKSKPDFKEKKNKDKRKRI
ncbi:MAG: DEAD/DEAH box helicase [Bacteroidales bacterium]|nr:DEAD/DEAH box helicase [Bacteroidales bacterium]